MIFTINLLHYPVGGGSIVSVAIMFELKIIQHADVTNAELDEIIWLKAVAWPYSYEKQLEWIHKNIKNFDLHLLLLKNNIPVSYLNLIDIELEIDNKVCDALGVGNVCAGEKGKGYGKELIDQTNKFIIEKKRTGMLFCKKELVNFYKKHNWMLLDKSQLALAFDNNNIESMVLNQSEPFRNLQYKGNPF